MEKIVSAVFAMTGQDATEKEVQVHADKIFTTMDTVSILEKIFYTEFLTLFI